MTNSNLMTKLKTKKAFIWLRMKINNKKHKDWKKNHVLSLEEREKKEEKKNDHLLKLPIIYRHT
jgi:hypothetical protein